MVIIPGNIWKAPWIPSLPNFVPQAVDYEGVEDEELMVADFILLEPPRWDLVKLEQLFLAARWLRF